jgi:hypothetical protein
MTIEVPYNVVGLKVTLHCVDNDGVAIPLTDAENLKIKLRPESGTAATAVVKTATLEGSGADGRLYCLTESGDIDTGILRERHIRRSYHSGDSFHGCCEPGRDLVCQEKRGQIMTLIF